ncbi:hypothetical protein PMAYCL1PPCAC_09257, partial [Pristionchus mayeri]
DFNGCLVKNCECSQLCRNMVSDRRCECFIGFTPARDGRSSFASLELIADMSSLSNDKTIVVCLHLALF